MLMNEYCAGCLLDKWLGNLPADTPDAIADDYRRRVRLIVEENPDETSPEKDQALNALHDALFGARLDWAEVKRHFNALMLELEPELLRGVASADDPLRRAVQYVMTGNFIDFAAMDSVDEGQLRRLIAESHAIPVDEAALSALKDALGRATKLTYALDNCGEIVMDKVLLATLKERYPRLELTAIVKGGQIVNDATREDAEQVGLTRIVPHIVDTGCAIAGLPETRLSGVCRGALRNADLVLSKGQANYETLCGSGLNAFYIFMCKCQLFMDRFNVPRFTGLIVQES